MLGKMWSKKLLLIFVLSSNSISSVAVLSSMSGIPTSTSLLSSKIFQSIASLFYLPNWYVNALVDVMSSVFLWGIGVLNLVGNLKIE